MSSYPYQKSLCVPEVVHPGGCDKNIVQTIWQLTHQLNNRAPLNRKRTICELGETRHVKALEPLCNMTLFDKDEGVRTVALTVIADIIRENPKRLRSPQRRMFVIHNVLNSWNKFPSLPYARAVKWFFSSINLKYEREEASGLCKTISGKKVTSACLNPEVQQVLDDICNIILSASGDGESTTNSLFNLAPTNSNK